MGNTNLKGAGNIKDAPIHIPPEVEEGLLKLRSMWIDQAIRKVDADIFSIRNLVALGIHKHK